MQQTKMTHEELTESFNTWWHAEGKFKVPSTSDYQAVKDLALDAWHNGAYVEATHNT